MVGMLFLLLIGVGVGGWMLLGTGCSRTTSFSVGPEPNALIIARYERRLSAGTETQATVLGREVLVTDAKGEFDLTPPRALSIGKVRVLAMISKPGYQLFDGEPDGPNTVGETRRENGRLFLVQAKDHRQERLAIWLLERAARGLCPSLDPAMCSLLDIHRAERKAFFARAYPGHELHPRPSGRTFKVVVDDRRALDPGRDRAPDLLGAIGLSRGRLAVVHSTLGGRDLVVLDADGRIESRTTLRDRGRWAAIGAAVDGEFDLYDAGGLTVWNADVDKRRRISLQPVPATSAAVVALTRGEDEIALAINMADGGVQVWRYEASGDRKVVVDVPEFRRLRSISRLPDGSLLVGGDLHGGFEYGARLGQWARRDGMPRGVMRIDPDGARHTFMDGVDKIVRYDGQLWCYAGDLFDPLDLAAIRLGFTEGLLRQKLFVLDDQGRMVGEVDITGVARSGSRLALASGTGESLVLYDSGTGKPSVMTIPLDDGP